MGKAPAFQFYANDFMDATSTWEANACGLYVRCLCKQWTHGSIPADLRILARAIHTDREELEQCWSVLGPKFVDQGDGTLKNRKLEEVRERQIAVSEKRSQAGKLGAIAKANANDLPQAKDKQRKVKEKEKVEVEKEDGSLKVEIWPTFQNFWDAYENKGNRKTAESEWQRTTQSEREAIMANVPKYNASKPDKQYRKDGERYLKHRVWEDAIVTPTTSNNGQRTESDILAATLALAGSGNGINGSNLGAHEHANGRRE
jgi:uncharacterized protein YdaU (DUF1376 family)